MIPEPSLSLLSTALQPFVEDVFKNASRLHAERHAGRIPITQPSSLMDDLLTGTLNRICRGDADSGWWQNLLDNFGHKVITPDFLKKPTLQEWLEENEVRNDLKQLATGRIMDTGLDDVVIRERLAESYSAHTGEAQQLAIGPIDVVTAILVAGYIKAIPDDQRAFAGMVQTGNARIEATFERLERSLPSLIDPFTRLSHTENVTKELDRIRFLRTLNLAKSRSGIQELAGRIEESGDLVHADASAKHNVRYWMARLYAGDAKTLDVAKENRKRLMEDDSTRDLSIIDALIAESDGNPDEGIRNLRDRDDPESRSVLFGILARSRGAAFALSTFADRMNSEDAEVFTAIGWMSCAGCMAEVGRWEAAAERLAQIDGMRKEVPALLLLEGIINAQLLLPDEKRSLKANPLLFVGITPNQGQKAEDAHECATKCFDLVEQGLGSIEEGDCDVPVAEWRLWLRLMNPREENRQDAINEIRQNLEGETPDVNLVLYSWVFNIEFDGAPLKFYLSGRDKLGGLSEEEERAAYFMTWNSMIAGEIDAREFLAHLEMHQDRLGGVLPTDLLIAMRIEALLMDNQTERAQFDLDESSDDLDEAGVIRLTAMIDAHVGVDPRAGLEMAYRETGNLIDLQNLINCLEHVGDSEALLPLLQELMSRQRTIANALMVVSCLAARPFFDYQRVLDFLESNSDLVAQSPELQSAKGWALFQRGQLSDAKTVNDQLLEGPEAAIALTLDFNIAVACGDWERLPAIVDREWPRRDEHDPKMLLILAQVAGQQGRTPDRALALARLAVEKAPDDARVLMAAYDMHIRFGRDEEAEPSWLAKAVEQSSEDAGPVWSLDFQTFVTKSIPERWERLSEIERKWLCGEIPSGIAASLFHMPLTWLLLQTPRNNCEQLDQRRNAVVPIVFGGRAPVELSKDWVVGLDISSILVLHYLELLTPIFDVFKEIKLVPYVMSCLLIEQDMVRFHQPSRVRDAQEVRNMCNQDRLRIVAGLEAPPETITGEVGQQLAMLLNAAKEDGGKVVCVLPIHRPGSLLEKIANTDEWNDKIVSVSDFCSLLHTRGKIDTDSHEQAQMFFRRQGQVVENVLDRSVLNGTIYLDNLVLSYLQDARILNQVAAVGLDLRIHPDVLEDLDALVTAGDSGEKLVREIDAIRSILRTAVETGKASYLPHVMDADDLILDRSDQFTTTRSLLAAAGDCDAICIDDRFVNSKLYFLVADQSNSPIPIACIFDLLDSLVESGNLSLENHWAVRHKLRAGGFIFFSVEEDELYHWLNKLDIEEGQLLESAELKAIRQSMARIMALGLMNQEEGSALSAQMPIRCASVIRSLWADKALTVEVAAVRSDWIWRHLIVAAFTGHEIAETENSVAGLYESMRQCVGLVFLPIGVVSEDRSRSYADWLENTVLKNLVVGNSDLVEHALSSICSAISDMGEEATDYGYAFLTQLPERTRQFLLSTFPEHTLKWDFKTEQIIVLDPSDSVVAHELFRAAREVLSGSDVVSVQSAGGREISVFVDRDYGNVVLEHTNAEDSFKKKNQDLKLVSPDSGVRLNCFRGILQRLGPTASEMTNLLSILKVRVPDDEELTILFDEVVNGVASNQGALLHKINYGLPINVGDIAPQNISYYEKFIGQVPEEYDLEVYIRETLVPYRQTLLNRDLRKGLDICLLGALRDDLCPGKWADEFEDDVLWEALSKYDTEGSPVALLGALDVALYRQSDARFRGFAEQAILKLSDDEFGCTDGVNVYELLLCFVQLMFNQINQMENGANRPGFWKRNCAWMQAQFVVRCLVKVPSAIAIDKLKTWCHSNMAFAGAYAELVNLREEPMLLHTSRMSPGDLRSEVLGRLIELRSRHEREGRHVPCTEEIDQAMERSRKRGDWTKCNFPGPLEGCRKIIRPLPDYLAEAMKNDKPDFSDPTAWNLVGNCSHMFRLSEAEIGPLLEAVGAKLNHIDAEQEPNYIYCLEIASIVAKNTRNTALADAIGDALVEIAKGISDEHDIYIIVQICLQAAAAYKDRKAWFNWLEDRLARIASVIPGPPNKCLAMFVEHLDSIESILPIESWFHRRAKFIAMSGASLGS